MSEKERGGRRACGKNVEKQKVVGVLAIDLRSADMQ